ncbi:MAG: DNA-binding protein, partial [Acidimicrobiia bacterium]|nr:DNA-binding protein [Acidimicrobiia bacterium]
DVDPKTFKAFGVGYVELPGELKIESRLTEADPEKLKIGMEMELVIVPLSTDANGNEVVTFAFAPVA